jgi:hypothetical protein
MNSYLKWIFHVLGVQYAFLLPATALLAFVLVLLVSLKGKDRTVGPCLVLIVPLPFLVGIFALLDGLIASFQVIVTTQAPPQASDLYPLSRDEFAVRGCNLTRQRSK